MKYEIEPFWQEGFCLRLANEKDAEEYFWQNFNPLEKETARLTGSRTDFTHDEVVGFFTECIGDETRYDFLILSPEGKIIGETVINEIDWEKKAANFRICIFHQKDCGKGIGFWAIEKTRDIAFHVLKLQRLELDVFSFNTRARRAYEKAGFWVEEVVRDAVRDGDGYADDILMACDNPMVRRAEQPEKVAYLFEGWQETTIWSCLSGIMGNVYVAEEGTEGDEGNSKAAMAVLGDFCFLTGEPLKELVKYRIPNLKSDFLIMVPNPHSPKLAEWEKLIAEYYGERAKKVVRYAIKKEGDVFDRVKLEEFVRGLPKQYQIQMIDEELYHVCKSQEWSRDFVAQYRDYEQFREIGLGVVVTEQGVPVAGASSYSSYEGGIEIEIVTRKEYRRQGLATVCGGKLVLECLKRGLYPSWDAQNLWSVGLAEKLGYHYEGEYDAFEIHGY